MLITHITISSKMEHQFCSATAELDEQDDARPEKLAVTQLDLKLQTGIACLVNAVADGSIGKSEGLTRIADLKTSVAELRDKLKGSKS